MEKLTCRKCNQSQNISEFYKTKKGHYNYSCRMCNRAYRKQLYPTAKINKLKQYTEYYTKLRNELHCIKAKIGCCICKERDPRALDFHHKVPEDKIAQVLSIYQRYGREKAMEEMSKCEIMCVNCHRKEHWTMLIFKTDLPILGDYI